MKTLFLTGVLMFGALAALGVFAMVAGPLFAGLLHAAIGIGGFLVGLLVFMLSVGLLFTFIFFGIKLFVLGTMFLFGLLFISLVFPFLLLLLIPLALVWVVAQGLVLSLAW